MFQALARLSEFELSDNAMPDNSTQVTRRGEVSHALRLLEFQLPSREKQEINLSLPRHTFTLHLLLCYAQERFLGFLTPLTYIVSAATLRSKKLRKSFVI